MNSDNIDGPEPSTRTTGKRKASKKALDKLKAAEKAKAKKKGEIDTDEEDIISASTGMLYMGTFLKISKDGI